MYVRLCSCMFCACAFRSTAAGCQDIFGERKMFASDLRRKFGLDVVNAKGRRARVRHDERAWVDEGAARGHGGAAVEEGDAVECGEGRDGGGAGHEFLIRHFLEN